MKRILMICVALLGMVLASCHQDEDDLFTTVAITLTAEEGTTVNVCRARCNSPTSIPDR